MKTFATLIALGLTLTATVPAAEAQTAPAQTAPAMAPAPAPPYGAPVSLDAAQALIDRAVAYGQSKGWRLAIAVVEPSGELVAFGRMDDTQYGSIYVAQRKAETAARYRIATAVMEDRTLAGRLVTLANADSLPIAGGIPIVVDGRIVGAIGVSGATAAQDTEAASAALAAD